MVTITVWITMNRQLPMNPVSRSAIRSPTGSAAAAICWLTGLR